MKIRCNFILIAGLFFFLIYSCEEKKEMNNDDISSVLTGEVIAHSECKIFKSVYDGSETPDTLSCINYTFDASSNTLTLLHVNTGFNCCPGDLYGDVSLHHDTIVIEELEEMQQCRCNCLFDLTIKLTGIEAKMYKVKFVEPYCGEQEKIEFELDLVTTQEGSYCVTRKMYPWGETDYEEDPLMELSGQLISNTGCKNRESGLLKNNIPDTVGCINYTFNDARNEILLKHINAGFNCCPDSLFCTFSLNKDTIIIEEFEKESLCDCLCLFDLDMKLEGVDSKKYYVKIIEPYTGDEEKLSFEMDLVNTTEGFYCVNRSHYPWIVY